MITFVFRSWLADCWTCVENNWSTWLAFQKTSKKLFISCAHCPFFFSFYIRGFHFLKKWVVLLQSWHYLDSLLTIIPSSYSKFLGQLRLWSCCSSCFGAKAVTELTAVQLCPHRFSYTYPSHRPETYETSHDVRGFGRSRLDLDRIEVQLNRS